MAHVPPMPRDNDAAGEVPDGSAPIKLDPATHRAFERAGEVTLVFRCRLRAHLAIETLCFARSFGELGLGATVVTT